MRNRDFDIEDTLLIQRSRTIRGHFINEMPAFTAFDPDLNPTYAANWLLSIDECEAHPTDETTLDQQQQHTDELEQAVKDGFKAASDLEFYVQKAFPDDESYMDEFGFSERKKARFRTMNQIVWLFVMKEVAGDYVAELTAVNMPPSVLTNLENAAEHLGDMELAQEYYKRIRKRLLRQRIQKYNRLYSFFIQVNKAAQSVFYNDEERRGLFKL
ncbi:MAG: hypothetical protein POELPBGB_03440 [Bacteroidia bacterium]|nr:hypothetical protein [Bacteroidia bacterium]